MRRQQLTWHIIGFSCIEVIERTTPYLIGNLSQLEQGKKAKMGKTSRHTIICVVNGLIRFFEPER